jgi:hypothetical protein
MSPVHLFSLPPSLLELPGIISKIQGVSSVEAFDFAVELPATSVKAQIELPG